MQTYALGQHPGAIVSKTISLEKTEYLYHLLYLDDLVQSSSMCTAHAARAIIAIPAYGRLFALQFLNNISRKKEREREREMIAEKTMEKLPQESTSEFHSPGL